ncbi:type III secretion system chaperone [Shewanella surugensis]|uniref:Type III secretion system chaperone n=1 Tax=Shewanella surugensis TaxID=212020 RepID=A0ABT0L8N9_9GAMM|nr:type III secretion system chaperone [Shewanella surugensis]MCL1123546.1 type III secretion system chaperone [Shewanella surugensis]
MIDLRDKWLKELKLSGTDQFFTFDEKGLCQLALNDDMLITLFKPEIGYQVVIFGQYVVSDLSQSMMQNMLIANRNNAIKAAPIVSLSENANALEVHLVLGQQELRLKPSMSLEKVIDVLKYWREQIINEVGTPQRLQPNKKNQKQQSTPNHIHFI